MFGLRTIRNIKKVYANVDLLRGQIDTLTGSIENLHTSLNILQVQLDDVRALSIMSVIQHNPITLETDFPVAYESNDHIKPRGTKNDNTRSARFCRAIEHYFKRDIMALDLGCAGGGLVFDFLIRGHIAIGLEGSDYSFKSQRAEWRVIGDYLFTCNVTKPFNLVEGTSGSRAAFDVISAWEFMEHIHEDDMPQLFANIKNHLAPDGLFVGSIPFYDDIGEDGTNFHQTVKPEEWWKAKFASLGLKFIDKSMFSSGDYCRGSGNGGVDLDFSQDPSKGFHFVATHA